MDSKRVLNDQSVSPSVSWVFRCNKIYGSKPNHHLLEGGWESSDFPRGWVPFRRRAVIRCSTKFGCFCNFRGAGMIFLPFLPTILPIIINDEVTGIWSGPALLNFKYHIIITESDPNITLSEQYLRDRREKMQTREKIIRTPHYFFISIKSLFFTPTKFRI